MLGHRLFGVLLHLEIDGRIDAQAVPVQVVGGAVGFGVLVQPAVQVVRLPEQGVPAEILPVHIVAAAGLVGIHRPAQHVAEIRGQTGIVVLYLVRQRNGNLLDGIAFRLGNVALFAHLSDHEIAAREGFIRVDDGIVPRGFVDHSHQQGALFHRQVHGQLGKKGFRSGPDAVGAAAEEDGVEVHVDDLLLRIIPLQFHRRNPFFQFDPHHPDLGPSGDLAAHIGTRIEGLGQLLGDGGTAALAAVAQEQGLEEDAAQSDEIDAGMLVEPGVFRRDGGVDEVGGQFLVGNEGPVLDMEGGQDLTVLGNNLRGKFAVRVFQFFERGNVGEHPDQQQHENEQGKREAEKHPEALYDIFPGCICHCKKISKKYELCSSIHIGHKFKNKIWIIAVFLLYFAS